MVARSRKTGGPVESSVDNPIRARRTNEWNMVVVDEVVVPQELCLTGLLGSA